LYLLEATRLKEMETRRRAGNRFFADPDAVARSIVDDATRPKAKKAKTAGPSGLTPAQKRAATITRNQQLQQADTVSVTATRPASTQPTTSTSRSKPPRSAPTAHQTSKTSKISKKRGRVTSSPITINEDEESEELKESKEIAALRRRLLQQEADYQRLQA
jgi:hypothetical protein